MSVVLINKGLSSVRYIGNYLSIQQLQNLVALSISHAPHWITFWKHFVEIFWLNYLSEYPYWFIYLFLLSQILLFILKECFVRLIWNQTRWATIGWYANSQHDPETVPPPDPPPDLEHHNMISVLLAPCGGNSPVTGHPLPNLEASSPPDPKPFSTL